jgi:hypothetical protein
MIDPGAAALPSDRLRSAAREPGDHPDGDDLFTLGRAAAAAAREAHGPVAVYARARQLLATGAWRGPRDAADAYVEDHDLPALGGLAAARAAGVRTLITANPALALEAAGDGELRVLLRLPFDAGESDEARRARLRAAAALAPAFDGVIPTPQGEPLGLDTLRFLAQCRLHAGAPHVIVDFARLGHRLSQMCLGFGADELLGPIVAERALRLGDNASNPAMTRKEAATLIRGAGLVPHERVTGGALVPAEQEPAP